VSLDIFVTLVAGWDDIQEASFSGEERREEEEACGEIGRATR
jgi:hypothetical protein